MTYQIFAPPTNNVVSVDQDELGSSITVFFELSISFHDDSEISYHDDSLVQFHNPQTLKPYAIYAGPTNNSVSGD